MPKRALRPCKQPGCPSLVASGYCETHKSHETKHNGLRELKSEYHWFYQTARWKRESAEFKKEYPYCMDCKDEGFLELLGKYGATHHEPPLEQLIKEGKDPWDRKYWRNVSFNCHQKHLNMKRWKK